MLILKMENMEKAMLDMSLLMNEDSSFLFTCTQPYESVIVGSLDDYDMEEIKKRGLFVTMIGNNGGTIVLNTGDVGLATYGRNYDSIRILMWLERDFIAFLRNKGLNAEKIDNDICIDGHKCCAISFTDMYDGKRTLVLFQISINVDLEAIKAICKKKMVKVPKGLSEFGITTEEVEAWLDGWIEENLPLR